MSTAIARLGNTAPRETNLRLARDENGVTATFDVRGQLEDSGSGPSLVKGLKTLAKTTPSNGTGGYARGGWLKVLGVWVQVTQTILSPGGGGIGTLQVTATYKTEKADSQSQPTDGSSVATDGFHEELEWQLQNKPLSDFQHLSNSKYQFQTLFSDPSSANYQALARWLDARQEDKYVARTAGFETPTETAAGKDGGADPAADDDWESLTGAALGYAEKVAKGIEEFMVQVPVYRKTSTTSNIGTSSNVGTRNNPSGHAPSGYVWLKTADNYTRDNKHGRWTHSEEWTGFASLDPDLYPSGS